VLEASRQAGVEKVIYASSAEVYGRPRSLPVQEDHITRPVTPYGASKLCGEVYCRTYQQVYGLRSVILRFFNVYGQAIDRRPRPTVDAIFVRRVAAGLPPILHGNPAHARDFIHVKDVARAIIQSIEQETAVGESINIASGTATSLEQLARIVIDSAGLDLKPEIQGPFQEPVIVQADIHKARRLLDFQPAHILADELKTAVAELLQALPDRTKNTKPDRL
jgi:UDP-glucose 4-epimerase